MSGSFFVPVSGQGLVSDSVPDDSSVTAGLTPSADEQTRKDQLEAFARMFSFRLFDGKMTGDDWRRLGECIRRDPSSESLLKLYLTAYRKSGFAESGGRVLRELAADFSDSVMLNQAAGEILIEQKKPREALPFMKQAFEQLLQNPSAVPQPQARYAILFRYPMTLFFEHEEAELNSAKARLESESVLSVFPSAAEVLFILQAARLEKEPAEPLTFFGPVRSRTLAMRHELDRCADRYFTAWKKDAELPAGGPFTAAIIVRAGYGERLLDAIRMEYLETGRAGQLLMMADISEVMKRNMTAARYLERYLASEDGPTLPVLNKLAALLHETGQDRRAAEVLERYADKVPPHPSLMMRRIEIYSALCDWDRALKAADALPKGFDRSYFRSVILQKQGRLKEAYAAVREARKYAVAEKMKFSSHSFYYHYCILAEKCGDIAAVDRVLTELVKSSPDDPELLNFLGYTLADHGKDLPRAETLIAKAVKLDPENSAILDSMAWVLYRLKRFAEAKEFILKAIGKSGEELDAVIADHAGDIFSANGDTAGAVTYWKKALDLPGDTDREKIRAKLKEAGSQKP